MTPHTLTPHQRKVLNSLARGKQPKHLPPSTKAALLRRELVRKLSTGLLQITEAGRAAMVAVIPHRPLLLHICSERGYTDRPQFALPQEPEAIDLPTLTLYAKEASKRDEVINAEKRLHERAKTLGRRIREESLATGRAGVDITKELEAIEHQLAEIEKKRQQAA